MTFQPIPGATLDIEGKIYHITEHPQAPGMPYGQEGRRAVVYQLLGESDEKYALKVFKTRFRIPRMVAVSEKLEPYATMSGLQACRRTVLTGSGHKELLREYPELTYAVLMPWVDGQTWQEMILDSIDFSPERSLSIARAFSNQLMTLEEKGLAHCDVSGANLIIQSGDIPALIDLEEMYGPGFLEPESLPAGSPGYAHRSAPNGQWNSTTDRFSGAILLAEMLCWFDPTVRDAAWGESYFAPKDMQNENKCLDVLKTSLKAHYGERILDLFNQAWRSDSLRDCPTFAEWAVALPEKIIKEYIKERIHPGAEENNLEGGDALSYYIDGQSAAEEGDLDQALGLYRKAITLAPPSLSKKIEKRIKLLDDKTKGENVFKQPAPVVKESEGEKYPNRKCPSCGEQIPAGQEVCPHCEGKPKAHQDQPSDPGGERKKTTLLGSGIGLIVILGIVLILLGRGGSGPLSSLETVKQTPTGIATNTLVPTATHETEPVNFLACQVTDVGGIDDKSFNATAWKGMEDAVADFGIEAKYLESQQQTDYEANINAFLEEGCDLIMSVGFLLGDATAAAAGANPDQMFGIVDVNWLASDNLYGSGFAINEATFLAGYLAAGMTETGIVATYGAINIPPVTIFLDGFVLGVDYYNEVHGTAVQTLGWDVAAQDGLFAGNFESTDDGRTMGESLLDEGADIIMPVAGPVGAGAIAVLEERGSGMIVGIDNDWSLVYANQAGIVLASAMKNTDKYVYETIAAVQDGTFAGGNYLGTLENGGVGLAYGGVDVPADLMAEVDALIPQIIAGEIVTTVQ